MINLVTVLGLPQILKNLDNAVTKLATSKMSVRETGRTPQQPETANMQVIF